MAKIIAFLRGAYEFRRGFTWTDPARGDDGFTELDDVYDLGRDWAHRLTFRCYDL